MEREIEDQVAQEAPRFEERPEINVPVDAIMASVNSAGDLVFSTIFWPSVP